MDREIFSATELSKFEYCPYQWYYEKIYGRNELRRLKKERNEELGIEYDGMSRMEEGIIYHKRLFRRMQMVRWVFVCLAFVCVYLLLKGGIL